MDIITRKEAIARGLTHYFTGEPCGRGHVAERKTCDWTCTECARNWFRGNLERRKSYYKANSGRYKETVQKYREANRQKCRDRSRKWSAKNPEKVTSFGAAHRAAKLNAKPAWLTQDQRDEITAIYEQAVLSEQLTGVPHHVDHIEPLQGEDRCGLHVPWNLQVLSAFENIAKGNRSVQHFHWKKI